MPAYVFDTISAVQADQFRAGIDTLSFNTTTTPTALAVSVSYGGAGAVLTVADRSVSFGSGFLGFATNLADGSKLVVGGAGADNISGAGGPDELLGGDGGDTLSGFDGADSLSGGPGDDVLLGGAGDDVLQGGPGNDTLDGGPGLDVLSFSSSTSGVVASLTTQTQVGEGADQFSNFEGLEGGAGADQLTGDGQANVLRGGQGDDTLMGLAGDDSLEGGRGDDLIDGGPGVDTLVYTNPTGGVYANLETSHAVSFDGVLGTDTLVGIENVIAGQFNDAIVGDASANRLSGLGGADTISGGGGTDTIDGGAGDDSLSGGDGPDWITGGPGSDTMVGGADLDIYEFSPGDSPATGLASGLDRILDFGGDILLFHGGVAATAANFIEVQFGILDPRVQAQGYFDQGYEYIAIQIGENVELFAPRTGNAVYLVGRNLDAIAPINIRVDSAVASHAPSAGDDSITGTGNETVDGLSGNDTITEPGGINYLRGGDGADFIVGGSGFDDINGNQGNDTCVSGGGDDWVVGGKDNDSLVGGDGQNLVYGNLGNDTCDGGAGNDTVRGGQDNDSLMGGAGNDYLSGDKGDDTITGGSGADIFHTFGDAGIDRVLDFHFAEGDRVQLDPGTQYTVAQVGADTVISMTGGGQMILVGVSMGSLPTGWIFGA